MRRLPVFEDVQQSLGEAIKGGRIDASRGEDWARDQRKMRPVNQRHSIQQE
jgi:hypothetical protein